jgi:hypothetical protein
MSGVKLLKARKGSPGNLVVELHSAGDNGMIASEVLSKTVIPSIETGTEGRFDSIDLEFGNLLPGRTYWIVIYQEDYAGDYENSYEISRTSMQQDVYIDGFFLRSENRGLSWIQDLKHHDLFFQTFSTRIEETDNLEYAEYSTTSLYLLNVDNDSIQEITQLPSMSAEPIEVSFTMQKPGKYVVAVEASEPFVIVIPEKYQSLWRVTQEKGVIHFPAYSFLNGYYINKTGKFEVTIEYALNNIFETSKLISISSMILVTALLLILAFKIPDRVRRRFQSKK